jgi:HPt (histidine-containing phosphotransfer) domain-containing protein
MLTMNQETTTQIDELLTGIWQRNIPVLLERLDILDSAATAAAAGILTTQSQEEARDISHKLAGILGTFGYHRATDIARQIEQLFTHLPAAQPDTITPLTIELRQCLFPAPESPNRI